MPIEAPFTEVIDTTTRFQYKVGFLGIGEYGVDAPGVVTVAEGNFFVADDAEVGNYLHVDTNAVGTAAFPSITVGGDVDTGIYWPGANFISFATGGIERFSIGNQISITPIGTAGTPALVWGGDGNAGFFHPAVDNIAVSTSGTERLRVGPGGIIFIGDGTTTTNAFQTIGLTIDQLANNDEIQAFKASTLVAHPFTGIAETDTYGLIKKAADGSGGLQIRGFKDADDTGNRALSLLAFLGENATTIKTTAGRCIVEIQGAITDGGTGDALVNADGNLVGIRNFNQMVDIFDAEGTLHLDLGGNGTAAAPSLTLAGEAATGFYRLAANKWGWSGASSLDMTFENNAIGLASNTVLQWGGGAEIKTVFDGTAWNWKIEGADSKWRDAAIAAFAAGADLDAEDTYWRFQDGGPDATVIGGNDGGHFNLTMGDGSDAGVASAANGGDGGDYELNPGLEGDGDGVGVHGLRGVIHEWERIARGGGRRIRGWTDQNDVAVLTVISELTMTLGDNEAWQIIVHAVAMESDGSDRAIYHLESLWYRDGAGATQQGATISLATIESDANWDLDFNGNGNDVEIRVNGNADTVNWKIIVEWLRVTT